MKERLPRRRLSARSVQKRMIREEIEEWINKYLTKQFIYDPKELPDDECLAEAKEILSYLHSKGVVTDEVNTKTRNIHAKSV